MNIHKAIIFATKAHEGQLRKGEDMQRLMLLCDNAENGREVVEYIYKRFSPDGYDAYLNILNWFEENGIKASSWMN